jgi:DNA-binding IclR family transcriptional regulator
LRTALRIESQVLKATVQTVQQLARKVSRLLRRLHLYGLIAKVPHARRWRVTRKGLRVFSSALRLRDYVFPELYATACA